MSYQVTAGTSITFSYNADDIFNSVSLRSHYRARGLKDGNGKAMLDDYALSPDERNAFNEVFKEAVYKTFRAFFKITKGIANSIVFNATGVNSCQIVDNEASNATILPVIDSNLEKALKYYCLAEWFKMVGVPEEASRFSAEYETELTELSNNTFQLRKVNLS